MTKYLISGVHTFSEYPPMALGMCMAYAKQEFAADSHFEISADLIANEGDLTWCLASAAAGTRHVLLFSNYLWSTEANLRLSREAKRIDPTCITIHGGPNTPAYTDASRDFLQREPHVDYAVAGEGEETLVELLTAVAAGEDAPEAVAGLRFLRGTRFVETAPRERARNLNAFPSPYLTGFFDTKCAQRWQSAIIETFRGCPYHCTFCDWGSLMGSKIKLFDLARVMAELEWLAENQINTVWFADSNFGMLERDVQIARKVRDLKASTGYPKTMIATFAKNVKSRVVDIVEILVEAQVVSFGIISLQSQDEGTLKAIRRSNIKTSEYEKLRQKFAEKNLTLWAELMLALPGSTLEAFKSDLRYHFDLPVEVWVHRTVMLANSPMAKPEYQREHQIVVDDTNRIISTATMTPDDIELASAICRVYQAVHRFGILRYLVRWLQWERGLDPLDLMHALVVDTAAQQRFPLLAALVEDARTNPDTIMDLVDTVRTFRERMRVENGWTALSTEFMEWVRASYGIESTPAVASLADVQTKLMPGAGRATGREEVHTSHDVLSWYTDWLSGRGRPLETYGPGRVGVQDTSDRSNQPLSAAAAGLPWWELYSELYEIRRESAKKPVSGNKTSPTDEAGKRLEPALA
jgi:hypothetical protein